MQTQAGKTVLVTGAGFTRAFLSGAPLGQDSYDLAEIEGKYTAFPIVKRILENERVRMAEAGQEGKLDLERIMTRLVGLMPYDDSQQSLELGRLLGDVKELFIERFRIAEQGIFLKDEMHSLTDYCVEHGIDVLTFNYDDMFDQQLFLTYRELTFWGEPSERRYWHPDGGYGFFCQPSTASIASQSVAMDRTSMKLLKLHGSFNWRVRRGHRQPIAIQNLVHHSGWFLDSVQIPVGSPTHGAIERQLEPSPLIVPPVLSKTELTTEPVLHLVWSQAFAALSQADRVIFVGYSLPLTDIAADFLFRETLRRNPLPAIEVVSYVSQQDNEIEKTKQQVRDAYGRLFGPDGVQSFRFDGALEWSKEFVASA